MKDREAHSNCPQPKSIQSPSTLRTKSPIRMNKQCNDQGSTKPLQGSYDIENTDSDTDRRVNSLNREEIINDDNTWNHFTVEKLISLLSFF